MKSDFLLKNDTAKVLYEYAKGLPLIDYHNHLSVMDIAEDRRFLDIYDLWIAPDPYKHRAMRMCGVEEYYITGNADAREKFIKWCETLPRLIGNPLYHWSLMELNTVFGISEIPSADNAVRLYGLCNKYLKENTVSASTLIKKFNVEFACPCASLADDISYFNRNKNFSPSLRGDDIVNPTVEFIKKLEKIVDFKISDLSSFKKAVTLRLEDFEKTGCVFSDHALDSGFVFYPDDGQNEKRFNMLLNGEFTKEDEERLSSYILAFLGGEYAKLGFVMQLHIGAQRYTSTRLRETVGPAGGFAAIGNCVDVKSLTMFLDTLERGEKGLPKTVLFTLNPADNAVMSVLSGSYSKDTVSGLITQGPAWWWCDHKKGIVDMLENCAAFSVLGNFIGMTTDSRSFLSFVRHDYFRRILCNWVGEKAETGEFPNDISALRELVLKMCYKNVKEIVKE